LVEMFVKLEAKKGRGKTKVKKILRSTIEFLFSQKIKVN